MLGYERRWTTIRNYHRVYTDLELVQQYHLRGVPTVQVGQFAAVAVRAYQLDWQISEIEKRVRFVTDMDDGLFRCWSHLTGEYRRHADNVDRLAQAVFTQQHLSPLEPVAAMSMGQIDDAPVEDPPHEQPPAKDPPVKKRR
jgi:hypothetical protein